MKSITAKDLCEVLKSDDKNVLLLDVRSAEEFEEGHIPGAINIPAMGLLNRSDELKGYERIFVNCKGGGRSMMACQYLNQKGFDNVYNVIGGFDAWKEC
ncbi:hypothetical protein COU74_02460 [Candidatus Peregrinibacteria bacterium CG10_big_fil_rev_8_21_14_0_10_36_19]|nr:MAG: hypothetical protein COU74_02460 [Candidatus Peregrinibacteria bacterium CG10_big_fil_rev_8_21_14_0_10_36_19]